MNNLENKKQIIFLTFGGPTNEYRDAVKRICNQATNLKIFNRIIGLTDLDLKKDVDFWEKHNEFIENNKRGYGYWLWKSYINKKLINEIREGDIVVYADAGCEFRCDKVSGLLTLIINLSKNIYEKDVLEKGIIGFELIWLEKMFNKMDLLNSMNLDIEKIKDTKQICATSFIYKKCKNTVNIMNEWYSICESNNYHNIDDTDSNIKNDSMFKEHRHDQSVFSLLLKKHNSIIMPYLLSNPNFTIWDARNRTGITKL